jgi:hypothetical protein
VTEDSSTPELPEVLKLGKEMAVDAGVEDASRGERAPEPLTNVYFVGVALPVKCTAVLSLGAVKRPLQTRASMSFVGSPLEEVVKEIVVEDVPSDDFIGW